MALFHVRNPGGSIFVAERRAAIEPAGHFGFATVSDLLGWFENGWNKAVEAKQPETERLLRNDLLYLGFHYDQAHLNRNNVVNNLPYMLVESMHSILVETLPRPEPVPLRGATMSRPRFRTLRETATWLMDTVEWDYCYSQGTRWKLVHGWHPHAIVFDEQTGMPYPKPMSVYDFYRNPDATSEDTMEDYFIAGAISTRWLQDQFQREQYPHLFDEAGKSKIKPDGWLSPGYFSFTQPFFYAMRGIFQGGPGPSTARHVVEPTDPASTTTTKLTRPYGISDQRYAETTFFVQRFVRNRRTIPVPYLGTLIQPDGNKVPGFAQNVVEAEAPSGWSCIQFDASGLYYDCAPVDPAFGGMNLVIGRHTDLRPYRFEAQGAIDPVAPLVRSINRRHNLLNKSLEFEAVPVLIMDRDANATIEGREIQPGEKVKKARGSELRWLEFRGASQEQFALLELEHRLFDKISGSTDPQRGVKPVGVEAAAALRQLTQAANTRVRALEGGAQREYAALLKKLMVCLGHKLKTPLMFKGTDGEPVYVKADDLLSPFDIRFAWGSGLAQTRAELEEKSMALFQAGLLDEEAVLDDLDYRGREQVLARLRERRSMEMLQQILLAKESGGAQNGRAAGEPAGRR